MSDSLARALAAPAPAAQPMGNQDMLARILMGTPDPGLPQYPGMEQAAPLAPTMRTGLNNDMWRSARIAEALRNDVNELFAARDPSRNYGTILPISSDPNAEGSTRFDLKGGLTGDLLAMLGAGGRAMRGEEYNPMDITTGMMTAAAPSLASRSSGVLHSAGGSARDGIRAYHGSPHQFDRFDMSRIGTGEGAQAYGHGLYFAGNEGVARSYRDQLSRPYYALSDGSNIQTKYGKDVLDAFTRSGGDPAELAQTIERLRSSVQRNLADFGVSDVSQIKPQYAGDLAYTTIEMARRADKLEDLIRSGGASRAGEGSMYEVRLNTTPDRLLDWDAPYQRQPPNVQGAMADVFGHENLTGSLDKTIGHRFGALSYNRFGREGGDAAASAALREAGIPGIQYLDAGSRATAGGDLLGITQGPQGWQAKIRVDNRGGVMFADPTQQITTSRPFASEAEAQAWALSKINDGTRNYVMFDDKLIDILRRYGLAGMLAGGAASQAQAGEPAP